MSKINKENGFGHIVNIDEETAFITQDESIVRLDWSDNMLALYVAQEVGIPTETVCKWDLGEFCCEAGMPVAFCEMSKADAVAIARAILKMSGVADENN